MTISKNFACLNCLQAAVPYNSEMPDSFVHLHHVALNGHRSTAFVKSSEVCVSACSACNNWDAIYNWMHYLSHPRIESRGQHTVLIKNNANSVQIVFRSGGENSFFTRTTTV